MFDVAQMERGNRVQIDRSRDNYLTEFGKATLQDRYLLPEESFQDLFARVSMYYGDDSAHAQRIYDYMSNLWFMPATPVLSNGGTSRSSPPGSLRTSVAGLVPSSLHSGSPCVTRWAARA